LKWPTYTHPRTHTAQKQHTRIHPHVMRSMRAHTNTHTHTHTHTQIRGTHSPHKHLNHYETNPRDRFSLPSPSPTHLEADDLPVLGALAAYVRDDVLVLRVVLKLLRLHHVAQLWYTHTLNTHTHMYMRHTYTHHDTSTQGPSGSP
jgi:hypothetical protein